MKKYILPLLLILVLLGCQQEPQSLEQDRPKSPSIIDEPEPVILNSENIVCDLSRDPNKIDDIELSIINQGLQKTSEGIVFSMKALDSNDIPIGVDGFLSVVMSSTKVVRKNTIDGIQDVREPDEEIYNFNFPIKKDDIQFNCSSKPLIIKFSSIENSKNYRFVDEDDPGLLTFEFQRTGSGDRFKKTYTPKAGEDLLHK
jgi:hypothetical protein